MLDETHRGAPQFDARAALARWAGVDLTRINGLAVTSVLSEIGPDLSRFTNVKHFCSWLGLCPGTKIGGGKTLSSGTRPSANRARQALKMAAMSLSRSHSALGAFYRQLCARMDKPRANTAVAHKLARMVHFMLTRGEAFVDQGQRHYEEQQHQRGGGGRPAPPGPPRGAQNTTKPTPHPRQNPPARPGAGGAPPRRRPHAGLPNHPNSPNPNALKTRRFHLFLMRGSTALREDLFSRFDGKDFPDLVA